MIPTWVRLAELAAAVLFILALKATVFAFFQDSARWAQWWGAGSTIDPRPGGKVYVRYPNNVEASGEVEEVQAPDRIVYTYGYVSGQPVGPGQSRVTITLTSEGGGTRLRLTHAFAEAAARDHHHCIAIGRPVGALANLGAALRAAGLVEPDAHQQRAAHQRHEDHPALPAHDGGALVQENRKLFVLSRK